MKQVVVLRILLTHFVIQIHNTSVTALVSIVKAEVQRLIHSGLLVLLLSAFDHMLFTLISNLIHVFAEIHAVLLLLAGI